MINLVHKEIVSTLILQPIITFCGNFIMMVWVEATVVLQQLMHKEQTPMTHLPLFVTMRPQIPTKLSTVMQVQ